jgi:hypothetical protein
MRLGGDWIAVLPRLFCGVLIFENSTALTYASQAYVSAKPFLSCTYEKQRVSTARPTIGSTVTILSYFNSLRTLYKNI